MKTLVPSYTGDTLHVDSKNLYMEEISTDIKQKIDNLEKVNRHFLYNNYGDELTKNIVDYFKKHFDLNDEIPLLEFLYSKESLRNLELEFEITNNSFLQNCRRLFLEWKNNNSKKSIEIDDELVQKMKSINNGTTIDNYTLAVESVDGCNDVIIINQSLTGNKINNLMGRFNYFFEELNHVDQTLTENSKSENYLEAEITSISYINKKINNLFNSSDTRLPNITCNGIKVKEDIKLSEILVGISNDKVYLKHKNKILIPKQFDQVNFFSGFSRIEKFLMIIYISIAQPYQSIFDSFISDDNFMPRLTYKGAIVSRAKFKLRIDDFSLKAKRSETHFMTELYDHAQRIGMPDNVGINQFGELKFININNKLFLKILYKELVRSEELILEELGFEYSERYDGRHYSQYLFSVENESSKDLNYKFLESLSQDTFLEKERVNIIEFSEMLYLKVYIREYYADDLLLYLMNNLPKVFLEKEFFFIRYWDPGFHLRLRIANCKSKFSIAKEIIDCIEGSGFLDINSTNSWSVVPYLPEVNRYGGKEMYPLVEKYFCNESKLIIELLSFEDTKFEEETLKYLIFILDTFTNGSLIKSKEILMSIIDRSEPLLPDFKRRLKNINYKSCIDNKIENNTQRDWYYSLTKMAEQESKTIDNKKLMLSILHMFINRCGPNLKISENQIYKGLLSIINHSIYTS